MNPERKFIHDIANPLGVAFGMLETVLDVMRAGGQPSPDDQVRLEKALKALGKISELLHQRRETIIAEAKKTADSSGSNESTPPAGQSAA